MSYDSSPFSIGDRVVYDGSGQFAGTLRKGDVAVVVGYNAERNKVTVIWEGNHRENDGDFYFHRFALREHKGTDATDTKDAAAYYEAITAQHA